MSLLVRLKVAIKNYLVNFDTLSFLGLLLYKSWQNHLLSSMSNDRAWKRKSYETKNKGSLNIFFTFTFFLIKANTCSRLLYIDLKKPEQQQILRQYTWRQFFFQKKRTRQNKSDDVMISNSVLFVRTRNYFFPWFLNEYL